jgi:2-polyprenyl-3-methyl-5-hydroxy-6-metoxy-1,4-benzoquinol methylase
VATDSGARAEHWAGTYRSKGTEDVSWFQREQAVSLRLLQAAGIGSGRSLIDVGGGASVLVDRVIDLGGTDVTVLDIAEEPLTASRARLGERAVEVSWLTENVLTWTPSRRYDLWHDRAVFHFLTEPADRDRYRQVLRQALAEDGQVVIATFADDEPTSCSGLPVARYSPEALADEFGDFEVAESVREEHATPWGAIQPFTWLWLRRP